VALPGPVKSVPCRSRWVAVGSERREGARVFGPGIRSWNKCAKKDARHWMVVKGGRRLVFFARALAKLHAVALIGRGPF
jgi:hypothetical protein